MSRVTRLRVEKVAKSACICGGRGPGLRIVINKTTGYYSWSFCNDCVGMMLFVSLGHGGVAAQLDELKTVGDHEARKVDS